MALNATMRGVVFDGNPFQVSVVDLPRPNIINHTDAVVRITTSAICGSDLHMYHGVQGGTPPWGMGHEAIGYISEIGNAVSSLAVGDYVVIPDNVDSGHLEMEPESLQSYGGGSGLDGLQGMNAENPALSRLLTSSLMSEFLFSGICSSSIRRRQPDPGAVDSEYDKFFHRTRLPDRFGHLRYGVECCGLLRL